MNDENGCSTCTAPGSEKYEKFQIGMGKRRRTLYQYDYRSPSGVLFSTCAPTLEECRTRRDRAFGDLGKKTVVYPFAGHNHYNIVHLLSV